MYEQPLDYLGANHVIIIMNMELFNMYMLGSLNLDSSVTFHKNIQNTRHVKSTMP